MAHVAEWKFKAVDELKDMLLEYPVIGMLDIGSMPAKQLQKIRRDLRGKAVIKMTRKTIMRHALKKAATEEKSLVNLEDHIAGQPAFIFSHMNPFKLNKILVKNRVTAPAKAGSTAPKDILIPKGETPFPAGPLLGELQQVGIPTTIAAGKITIKEDKVVVKEGETISPKLAEILGRLEIEPMELALDLLAAYESGVVFPSDVLTVDEAGLISNLQEAHRQAVNLSVNSAFLTKATASIILTKAVSDARALALEAGIYEKDVMDLILAKAQAQAVALESVIKGPMESKLKDAGEKPAPKKEKKTKAKEEPKAEEKPAEEPEENGSESDPTNIKETGEKEAEK